MFALNVTPDSFNLVIGALRTLPHSQVHDLVMDLWNQYQRQLMDELGQQAAAEPVTDSEGGHAD